MKSDEMKWQASRNAITWLESKRDKRGIQVPCDGWSLRGPHGSEPFNLLARGTEFAPDRTIDVSYKTPTDAWVRFEICTPDGYPIFYVKTFERAGTCVYCRLPRSESFGSVGAPAAARHRLDK